MRRALAALLVTLVPRVADAAPLVWAVDDGEKIRADVAPPALAQGNAIWAPGQPIRLFAARNETVAFQIVVSADTQPLAGVTVDLEALAGPARIANTSGATDPTRYVGRPIERFVEHYLAIPRPSGGKAPRESLGWAPGSGPEPTKWTGLVPDALIPVEVAPAWAPYPMAIAAHRNGAVWIDVAIGKDDPPGSYRGSVVVKSGAEQLATLPIELEIADVTLPDRPVRTMVFYDPSELRRRIGDGAAAEEHLLRLLHRHRLAPMHGATSVAEAQAKLPMLDGSFYTRANGYEGPLEGQGDGVLALGPYGSLGEPDATKLRSVEEIALLLESRGVLGTTDTFVYAVDEDCKSARGPAWKRLLAASRARAVRVAWTCSEDPTTQPVDVPIQAATFDATKTAKARALGKEVWAYNGHMPQTGSFLTDTPAISLRVNGWLSGMFDVGRWFFWESTFWYDDNRGGHGPYDPFATPETFHNSDGDWSMGDGVLLYPGKQVDGFSTHSIGMDGVVASIRLKNWRRGIEDAGYYQLAHAADPTKAEAIARGLFPVVLSEARNGRPPSWPEDGKPYFDARRALLALVPRGTHGGPGLGTQIRARGLAMTARDPGCGCRGCAQAGSSTSLPVLGFAAVALLVRRLLRQS